MVEKLDSDGSGVGDDIVAAFNAWGETPEGLRTIASAENARAEGRTVPVERVLAELAQMDEQVRPQAE